MAKQTQKEKNEFYEKAAKMIPYPVDIYYKTIDIPEDELKDIGDNINVMFLVRQHGFKIQSCIEVIKKEVFDPVCNSVRRQTVQEQKFKVGEKFSLITGFRTIEITEVKNSKIYFKYIGNVERAPGDMKIDDLERAIKNQKAYKKDNP